LKPAAAITRSHSMKSNDPLDLPRRPTKEINLELLPKRKERDVDSENTLKRKQADALIHVGTKAFADCVNLAVEIVKIRARTDAEVDLINAKTSAMEAATRAELSRMKATESAIMNRAEVVTKVLGSITEVIKAFPETDTVNRASIVDLISRTVDQVLSEGERKSS